MAQPPTVYSRLLGEKVGEHDVRCWLVNTGWTGGPYGDGHRMPIQHTRAMINAAIEGRLDDAPTAEHPVFGLQVPTSCPGVPPEVLDTHSTWGDGDAYDAKALQLAGEFHANFEPFSAEAPDEVAAAGPTAGRG